MVARVLEFPPPVRAFGFLGELRLRLGVVVEFSERVELAEGELAEVLGFAAGGLRDAGDLDAAAADMTGLFRSFALRTAGMPEDLFR